MAVLTTYQMFFAQKNGTLITGLYGKATLDGSKGSFREIGNGYYTFEVVPATTSTTRVLIECLSQKQISGKRKEVLGCLDFPIIQCQPICNQQPENYYSRTGRFCHTQDQSNQRSSQQKPLVKSSVGKVDK